MKEFTITEDFPKSEIEFDMRFSDPTACYDLGGDGLPSGGPGAVALEANVSPRAVGSAASKASKVAREAAVEDGRGTPDAPCA